MKLRHRIYNIILVFAFTGATVGGSVWYTNYVDRHNREGFCDLVVYIAERGKQIPNPTPDQVEYFRLIEALRKRQGCK